MYIYSMLDVVINYLYNSSDIASENLKWHLFTTIHDFLFWVQALYFLHVNVSFLKEIHICCCNVVLLFLVSINNCVVRKSQHYTYITNFVVMSTHVTQMFLYSTHSLIKVLPSTRTFSSSQHVFWSVEIIYLLVSL
jgi:hypothetical protein